MPLSPDNPHIKTIVRNCPYCRRRLVFDIHTEDTALVCRDCRRTFPIDPEEEPAQ